MSMTFFKHIKTPVFSIAVLAMLVSYSGYSNYIPPQIVSSEWVLQEVQEDSQSAHYVYGKSLFKQYFNCYTEYNFNTFLVFFNRLNNTYFRGGYNKELLLKTTLSKCVVRCKLPSLKDDIDYTS